MTSSGCVAWAGHLEAHFKTSLASTFVQVHTDLLLIDDALTLGLKFFLGFLSLSRVLGLDHTILGFFFLQLLQIVGNGVVCLG